MPPRNIAANAAPLGGGATADDAIQALVEVADAIASSPDCAQAWDAADPIGALREAAIPMAHAERVALVDVLMGLATSSPRDADAVLAYTFAVELAEPLADPASPGARAAWSASNAEIDPGEGAAAAGASGTGSGQDPEPDRGAQHGRSPGASEAGDTVRRALRRIAEITGGRPDALLRRIRQRSGLLSVGAVAPAYAGRDTAGNEVHSSEWSGRIVVLRFWDHDAPASVAAHERDMVLLRRHWNAPVELVGVSVEPDRERHLDLMQDLRLGGTQLYEGPIGANLSDALARRSDVQPSVGTGPGGSVSASSTSGSPSPSPASPPAASQAMFHPSPGALFVLDGHGRVRGRDLSHRELDGLLAELVAEHRAAIRARRAPEGTASEPDPPQVGPVTRSRAARGRESQVIPAQYSPTVPPQGSFTPNSTEPELLPQGIGAPTPSTSRDGPRRSRTSTARTDGAVASIASIASIASTRSPRTVGTTDAWARDPFAFIPFAAQ